MAGPDVFDLDGKVKGKQMTDYARKLDIIGLKVKIESLKMMAIN